MCTMADLFNYSPINMDPADFWSILGIVAFLVGLKLAVTDSSSVPSHYGLIFSLSSSLFVVWIQFYH